jgi:hypothetical protein
MYFSFREKSSRLFYCLSREEFSAARSEPIVFLFGASGAEGQARET